MKKVGKISTSKRSDNKSKAVEIKKSALKEKITEFILNQSEFKESLKSLAEDIRKSALKATNEATIAQHFELLLYSFLKDHFGIQFLPEKEQPVDTLRHVGKGRIDSRLGGLVIEYKHRSKFNSASLQDAATKQITNYMRSIYAQSGLEVLGFITDGEKTKFVVLDESGTISESSVSFLSGEQLDRLVRNIVLLGKSALTPENFVKDFCIGDDAIAKNLAITLFDALKNRITDRSQMLFNEWKALFKLAHDDVSKQRAIQERRDSLASALNITIDHDDNDTEYMALYAIQTAYAIIVKAIAYKVIAAVRFQTIQMRFADLARSDSAAIRSHLDRLEDGAIFREIGFGNLLEGDFFAWYCTEAQWSTKISLSVKKVFSVLTQYEEHRMFGANSSVKVQDLFKDLYMHVIPDKVRHSLGEFYTPPWLADNLVDRALEIANKESWKGLDPCCGSGTFITVLIRLVLEQMREKGRKTKLKAVLSRVRGIDLNPLAVLTARINYFINISHLIDDEDEFEIPIYLGDASYVPQHMKLGKVDCLKYQITTLKNDIDIVIPVSATNKPELFSKAMTRIETHIKNLDADEISNVILGLVPKREITTEVRTAIENLSKQLVELEFNNWNGIWARIITNFLTTANIGKFDVIVGNPPWIDWKNLPTNYRERIKSLCLDRKLFSGDSITGGINLNICALISNVAAENWLSTDGILAFLMPENMIFQQSYEGFRKFHMKGGKRLYFQEFFDWTCAGHPFHPVQHRFLSYFISATEIDYRKGIPVRQYIKKTGIGTSKHSLTHYRNRTLFSEVEQLFNISNVSAFVSGESKTIFSYTKTHKDISRFTKIAGSSSYTGRQGIEFYPQELYLLKPTGKKAKSGMIFLTNLQNTKSKHKIAATDILLETDFLRPLIKGVNIQRFHIDEPEFYVPFPYDQSQGDGRKPIGKAELTKQAPNLMKYLNTNKQVLADQTSYNRKIIGDKNNSEFYALARVGMYSYAPFHVVFRDNTKHCAAVVKPIASPWGEVKAPVFQKHAVSICERPNGEFISEDEAHFICAILNAPIVEHYLRQSSDSRSYKIRPQFCIPVYDITNSKHVELRDLSINAHKNHNDQEKIAEIDARIDEVYLSLFSKQKA